MSYEFYTSDLRRHTITTDGSKVTWGDYPKTELWVDPAEYGWRYPYRPISPTIPAVIRRKPKRDPWKKYTEGMRRIREVKDITEATKAIEVRPVLICGWCGARIPRGKEEDPCEYCGS